jgi:hypothetical protein
VPDDRESVICMFCGSNIIVQQAIQLATGRVQTFTTASEVERQSNTAGFGIALVVFAVIILLIAISAAANTRDISGVLIVVAFSAALVGIGILLIRHKGNPTLLGYQGDCPYCGTKINFPVNVIGLDCFACNKRIVYRDRKFLSVDTPVGFARKPYH